MSSLRLKVPARQVGLLVFGSLVLSAAAAANGGPILFPDELLYLLDWDQLVRLSWPANERPLFYGLVIWFLHQDRTT